MAYYKNLSTTAKTFYGVTFQPGEIKEVPGYINDKYFMSVDAVPQEPPKRTDTKPTTSSQKQQKSVKLDKVVKSDVTAESVDTTVELEKKEEKDGTDSNK